MNLTCNRDILSDALVNVSRAIPSKSTLPPLEGVLLKAENGQIHLTGYDLETGISTSIEARVESAGEIVLSARLFSDIIRKMPCDTITIETDEKQLTRIQGGVSEFTILGIPSAEYPELPAVSDCTTLEIGQQRLKSMIEQTQFAIAATDAKPVHTGSKFVVEDGHILVVSVDGYRLAIRKEVMKTGEERSFVVPGKTLGEISKMIKDGEEPARISVARRHVIFQIEGYEIVTRLLEGEFLDFNNAVPQGSATTVEVGVRDFIDSIERTSLLITDRLRSPLRVEFSEEGIHISCSTAMGRASDHFQASITGNRLEMGFNNKYLLDALRASGTDKVKVELNGPLSPVKIIPMEGDEFLFLVLPVRLKSEA